MLDREGQAGASEAGVEAPARIVIEVTPEMIEAGVREMSSYDSRFEMEEDCVPRIFLAMLSAWFASEALKAAGDTGS